MNTKHHFALFFSAIFCTATFGQGTWIQKTNFGGTARFGAVGFSIGNKGYIGTGNDGFNKQDFWEWNQATNTWAQKANFGGAARYQAVGFSIGTKGYIGIGGSGLNFPFSPLYKDFWEYDPSNNTWTKKADFGGTARGAAVGFAVGNKGYIGTGFNDITYFQKDFWEYDPGDLSNGLDANGNPMGKWTPKANFGGTARSDATGFSIGTKGYIGTGGYNNGSWILYKDFWEYDPITNLWTKKADFGGTGRVLAVGFSVGTKGYIGMGGNFNTASYSDFWEYDPINNQWIQKANFGGTTRWLAAGFSIDNKGYIGTGGSFSPTFKDFWEYDPAGVGVNELNNRISISVFPNPAHDYITIDYTLKENVEVSAELYDLNGRKICSLLNTTQQIGEHREMINLSAMNLQSGVYSLMLKAGDKAGTKKLIISR